MSFEHPYPDHAYLERDPETNEKRWFGSKGMGVCYVHEDRANEAKMAAVAAERDACVAAIITLKKKLIGLTHGARDRGYLDALEDAEAAIRNRSK